MKLRAEIDRKLCCGTSNCAEAAPDAYEMDDRNEPHVLAGASDAGLRAGAEACPMSAITLVDIETGRKEFP